MNSSCFLITDNLNFRRIQLNSNFVGNVFLNKKQGTTEMKLNQDAYRILDLLDEGRTLEECALALAEEYDEKIKNVAPHVKALVDKMVEKGFGTLVSADSLEKPQSKVVKEIRINSDHHLDGVAVTLLSNCNLKCRHCYGEFGPDKCDKLGKEEVFDLIDQMKALHCKDISLTGGEVMLHEDLFEILKYATEKNLKVSFLTNGVMVDEEFVNRLDTLGPVEVQLSIDGHNAELHDDFRGVKGSFDKTMNAFRLFREKDYKVVISHIATLKNCDHTETMRNMVEEMGGQFKMGSIIRYGRGSDGVENYYVTPEGYYEIHKNMPRPIEEDEDDSRSEVQVPDYLERCNGGKTRFAVKANGTAVPCDILPDLEDLKMGNIKEQKIEDFAFSFNREKGMGDMNAFNLEDCKGCKHLIPCRGGCLAVSYAENGRFDTLDIFSCARTKAGAGEEFEYKANQGN